MNMPDIEALQELMSEMGAMDYEELKKRKRGMPGMTKIEIESNQPIDPQKIASAMGGAKSGMEFEMEDEGMDDEEENKRRMMQMMGR